jgi:hypothetical protein
MTNRNLTPEQVTQSRVLLTDIRNRLIELSAGDKELRFAYNRKVYKELQYDERGTPALRRRLKKEKFVSQSGLCAIGRESLEPEGRNAELDRFNAVDGYTAANTRLVCHSCHRLDQEKKGFR